MAIMSATSLRPRCVQDVRCHCGQLIARMVETGFELKCKRCRRVFIIPFSNISGWGLHVN